MSQELNLKSTNFVLSLTNGSPSSIRRNATKVDCADLLWNLRNQLESTFFRGIFQSISNRDNSGTSGFLAGDFVNDVNSVISSLEFCNFCFTEKLQQTQQSTCARVWHPLAGCLGQWWFVSSRLHWNYGNKLRLWVFRGNSPAIQDILCHKISSTFQIFGNHCPSIMFTTLHQLHWFDRLW